MPQYKSFRKKNRYKTLKYSHKNKYRGGAGPIKRLIDSLRSRVSSRARIHSVPNPDEREKKIQRLLRATTRLLFHIQLIPSTIFDNIEVHNPITMTSHHINYATDGGLLTYAEIQRNARLLMEKLESPDIINDSRIINARSEIRTDLRRISDRAETIGRSIVNDSIPPRRIYDRSFY